MNISSLLASDNYIVVNKDIIKKLGLIESIVLGEIASEYSYWKKSDLLDDEGYFYSTVENIKENTSLSQYQQSNALKKLCGLGIVDIKKKDVPAKRYIRINDAELLKLFDYKLSKNLTTGDQKISPLEVKKFDVNNNKGNNNNNSNNYPIPYDRIIDYLNKRTGSGYRPSSKKTRDLIKARFNEGFTEEDFYQVIDKKTADWLSDNRMNKFLRPETLFGTKFESYLNQKAREMTTKDLADKMDFSGFMEF